MAMSLKDMRKEKGRTLQEMAGILGLKTASAYFKKESGNVPLSLEEAVILAEFFDKSVEEIIQAKLLNEKDH